MDWVNLLLHNCELCNRLCIIVCDSYILFAVQMVHSCFHFLSYFILSYITVLCCIWLHWFVLKKSVTQFLMLLFHLQHKKLLLFYTSVYHCLLVESTPLSILFVSWCIPYGGWCKQLKHVMLNKGPICELHTVVFVG